MAVVIIPDVHGRTFWKDAVKDHEEDTIVFLGDYLDPYLYEFDDDIESAITYKDRRAFYDDAKHVEDVYRHTIDNFKEIIEFKKQHPNTILLIGNHDCSYAVGSDVCNCRRDIHNYKEIVNLFEENRELFQIAYETTINGKKFLFSHAGAQKEYINDIVDDPNKFVTQINEHWKNDTYGVMQSLGYCSFYRGGWKDYGSCVWADLREYNGLSDTAYQIFGHTQLESDPYITDKWACLDVRRGFILNDEGEITRLDGVSIPKKVLASSEEDIDS